MWKWSFIIVVFLAGLYTSIYYGTNRFMEPFQPRCPDILVQQGSEIWLKNSKLAEIPGVNPVVFHNLEEYTRFVEWQRSQKIDCPVLFLQQSFDAQNASVYTAKAPPELLIDASRGNPPYNTNSYPAMDPHNQALGKTTVLDVYGEIGETQPQSANPMDSNWGGVEYSLAAVNSGVYAENEVYSQQQNQMSAGPAARQGGERDMRGSTEKSREEGAYIQRLNKSTEATYQKNLEEYQQNAVKNKMNLKTF